MRILITALAALGLMAGCTVADQQEIINLTGERVDIRISCSDLEVATRAYMDDVAVTQPWESKINTAHLYVYGPDGNRVGTYNLLTTGYTTVSMPREVCGKTCTFYVAANATGILTSHSSRENFVQNATISNNPRNYMSNYAGEMFTRSFYTSGFPMFGETVQQLEPYGWMSEVHVELKRVMAKIAFEWRVSPDFASMHDGAGLRIDQVSCGPMGTDVFAVESDPIRNTSSYYNSYWSQEPRQNGDWNENLWYMYEHQHEETSPNKMNPRISLSGIYDKDGDFSTVDDQSKVYFTIPVDYLTGKGELRRNTVYRISAEIKGVGDNNLRTTFEQLDWVTPPVHETEVGI